MKRATLILRLLFPIESSPNGSHEVPGHTESLSGSVHPHSLSDPLNFLSESFTLAVRHTPLSMLFLCLMGLGRKLPRLIGLGSDFSSAAQHLHVTGTSMFLPRKRQACLSKSTALAGQRVPLVSRPNASEKAELTAQSSPSINNSADVCFYSGKTIPHPELRVHRKTFLTLPFPAAGEPRAIN